MLHASRACMRISKYFFRLVGLSSAGSPVKDDPKPAELAPRRNEPRLAGTDLSPSDLDQMLVDAKGLMRALFFDAYERYESCPYDLAHDLGKTLCILGQRKQKGQDMPVVRLIGEVLLSAAERRVSGPKVGSRVMCDGLGGSSGSGKARRSEGQVVTGLAEFCSD